MRCFSSMMFCNSSSLKVGDEREKEREKERERESAMLAFVVPLKDARRVYCYRCYDACARVL
jgi:hypothetical protein